MPHLLVREPGQVVVAVPLRNGFRAGRHEQNDLVLNDHQASRQHAEIAQAGSGWEVRDLGSTHGTRVNGERVSTSPLRDGDRIQIGSTLLSFCEEDEPRAIVHHQVTEAAAPAPAPGGASDQRLSLVYEVSRAIGEMSDPEQVLGRMLSAILDVLGCDRAMAGLCEAERGPIRRVVRTRGAAGQDEIVVSRSIVEALLGRREGVIVRNEPGQNTPKTLVRERILSAMGVPLQTSARLLGFLYVDDRSEAGRFSTQDLEFLTALSHLTAAAIEGAERLRKASAMAEAREGPTAELIGASEPMTRLKAQIHKFGAASGANVLIRGESGTGKELVARALHSVSPRSEQPFVTLNCAAIPETMIEAELFGYDKGAFTGATRDKRGKFALADKGTLFLDEIGDLNLAAQAKVLRAVQEGEIQPLGSERTLRVNVRIVSATHKDLHKEIEEKRFREDLFYRLNVVEVLVPPLRERGGDVELLAHALLKTAAVNVGKRLTGFTPAALDALRRHRWPGNVRELRNEVERAAINAESSVIGVEDLSPRILSAGAGAAGRRESAPAPAASGLKAGAGLADRFAALEPTERGLIEEALAAAKGNLSEAARLLGITRIMMKRRVDRFGLKVRDDEP